MMWKKRIAMLFMLVAQVAIIWHAVIPHQHNVGTSHAFADDHYHAGHPCDNVPESDQSAHFHHPGQDVGLVSKGDSDDISKYLETFILSSFALTGFNLVLGDWPISLGQPSRPDSPIFYSSPHLLSRTLRGPPCVSAA